MRKLIYFVFIFLTGCSIVPANKSKQSGTGISSQSVNYSINARKDDITDHEKNILSLADADKKLASEVGLFIHMNKISESGYIPDKQLNTTLRRPVISVTEPEMKRLKSAWASSGEAHNVLARRFARADEEIAAGLTFPPEGGQHNQWYQCDSCQRGLTTIDAHHHKCPSCNRIYSGFPFDNVLYNRQHSRNIRSAEDAAWAWAVTGQKKYADFAASVLTGYAERYLNYPMVHAGVNDKTIDIGAGKTGRYRSAGHMQSQTLDESNTMIPAVTAYDLIYNTLSQQQKQDIEKNFLRAMAESINMNKTGKSNWQTWHNAALLYAGAVMGDGAMIRQALLDDKNGFTAQMKISVLPEGMWYENSWGYHYYTLSAMTHIAEGARRLGFDIYHYPVLRNMYLIAFDYLMNDGSLPRFGDAVQDSPARQGVNEKAWAVYKDDRLLTTLPSEISWDAIVLGRDITQKSPPLKTASKLIAGAGHAILATDGPGKLTAALSFGPYGGFHGHFDKLSFVFFGYGEELGVDPGRAASQAYRLPIHRDWYKASTGHNVVLVDGNSQKEAEGKCLAFSSTSSYAAITADAGPAFSNISHVRFILLTPDYLLVIDELKNNDGLEHSYDWLYHNKGNKISCSLPEENMLLDKIPAGYAYLRDITAHRSDKLQSIPVTVTGEKVNLYLTMAGEAGDEVYTANGPFSSTADRAPMVILRRKGQTVMFAAVIEPVGSAGKQSVKKLTLTKSPEFSAIITREGGKDLISFPARRLDSFIVQQETKSGLKTILKN
jgi:rubrerythrin